MRRKYINLFSPTLKEFQLTLFLIRNHSSNLIDKDREMHSKIEEVRCDVASMWEDRLL